MTDPDHVAMPGALYDAVAPAYAELIGTEVTAAVEGPQDLQSTSGVRLPPGCNPAIFFRTSGGYAALVFRPPIHNIWI